MNPYPVRLLDGDKYVDGLSSYIRSLTTDQHIHGGVVMLEGLMLLDPNRAAEVIGALLTGFSVSTIKTIDHAKVFRDELVCALKHIDSVIARHETR